MKMIARALPRLLSVALTLDTFTAAYNISRLLLELGPTTQVFYPSDANWTDTVQRWTTYDEPTFVAALKPASVADLQTIVSISASFFGLRVASTVFSFACSGN